MKKAMSFTPMAAAPRDAWLRATLAAKLVAILAMVPPGRVDAQEIRVVTLPEVVAHGIEYNHNLRSVRFVADEARAADRVARAAMLPAVRGEGSYWRLSNNIPDFELTLPPEFGGGDFSVPAILDRYDLTLRVEQPVFTGFRLLNQKKAAGLSAAARNEDTRAAEAETAFAIRAAYWNLFEAEEALEVARASERAIELHLANTVKRREQGAALASDVLSLQARLGEAKLDALNAENLVRTAVLRLSDVSGLSLDGMLATSEPGPIDWTTVDADALEAQALDRSPVIRGRTNDLEAARSYTRVAQAGWLPQVFFVGLYQYARPNAYIFPQEDVFTGTWQIGLSARWDLWSWGQTGARTSQARARARQLDEQLAAEKRAIQFAVREAVMNVEHRRLAVSVAEQNVDQANAALAAMERRYDVGAALTTEVLDAEVSNRNAQLQYARATAAYGVARAGLLRDLGLVYPNEQVSDSR